MLLYHTVFKDPSSQLQGFVSRLQPEHFSPRAGFSASKAQDQGDGSYSNTICVFLDKKFKIYMEILPFCKNTLKVNIP